MIPFLPLQSINASFEPQLSQAVQRVVQSGWYLLGEESKAFEGEFARWLGASYCVGVGSGLDALTLALRAMAGLYHWPAHAEVIVPDMTFVATAEAVVLAGLVPVVAEVDDNALLTAGNAEKVRTARTKAVIPVHLYGHPADMPALCEWAGQHGLVVLEDAAQAHGAEVCGKRVGCWGHAAAFSFYPGKNLGALGNGGAVVTDDADLARRVRTMANYGAQAKYCHELLGVNSRLDELQAAALRVKLQRLDADNEARRQVARLYAEGIRSPHVVKPYQGETQRSVFHIYPLRCLHRDALARHLAAQGVETLVHYPRALSWQPALQPYIANPADRHPNARCWAMQELSLPISPLVTPDEVSHICEAINHFNL
ncbi:MAG: DegT/DnrJ/EryC1/StrS family aminotransferase [Alloprevotella sp.]